MTKIASELGAVGIVIVDHGSKMDAANEMLEEVAQNFRDAAGAQIVEIAHMELASPTIEEAIEKCVRQGAMHIIVHPYFLAPGRHSTRDIPAMTRDAAAKHPEVTVTVTDPLGADPAMSDIISRRIAEAIARSAT